MLVVVTYDVETATKSGQTRLRRVARICENYGQHVQNSVFECVVDNTKYTELKLKLKEVVDLQRDSVRFYLTGNKWEKKVDTIGKNETYNPEGELII